MFRCLMTSAALLSLWAVPLSAQSQQDELDARYNRALAAGYKALTLCGAIFNARDAGTTRTEESVLEWELTGIYPALDPLIGEMTHQIGGDFVTVEWATGMPPRLAQYQQRRGCRLAPIGFPMPPQASPRDRAATLAASPNDPWNLYYPPYVQDPARPDLVEAAFAPTYGEGTRTSAALVTKNGQLVAERYAPGFDQNTPQRTWSVAKSIAATIAGHAVHRGLVKVDQSAGLGATEDDPRRAITIDHLLRMASGRYSDTPGNRTDPLYVGGSSVAETALHWPLVAAPGSSFRYANNDTLAAMVAIEAAEPKRQSSLAGQLIAMVGMNDTTLESDWGGASILSSQVWSTARDLVRFGQLYLNDGKLPDGTRILPEGWVKYVSTPSGPQPEGEFGYGAGFWLMNKSPGIPPDTFAAFGNRGQYVVIVPRCDVVIVRRGEDPAGSRFDIASFTRDVLAAFACSEKRHNN